jgi:hypothetical protein
MRAPYVFLFALVPISFSKCFTPCVFSYAHIERCEHSPLVSGKRLAVFIFIYRFQYVISIWFLRFGSPIFNSPLPPQSLLVFHFALLVNFVLPVII